MTEYTPETWLDKYRLQYEAGDPVALTEAVLFAALNKMPIPDWAVPGLKGIIKRHLNDSSPGKQGVVGPYISSKRDRHDYGVWSQVKWLMDIRGPEGDYWWGIGPRTQKRAFEIVADIFKRGTNGEEKDKFLTPNAVKNTFFKVECIIRSGGGARYGRWNRALSEKSGDL